MAAAITRVAGENAAKAVAGLAKPLEASADAAAEVIAIVD